MRSIIVLLVLASLAFSTAPGWVTAGVVLDYSAGSDTIKFTVLERTGDNVKTSIKVSSAPNPYTANENASGSSGQFWFDKDQFSNPPDFTILGQSKQTFAGKEWNTITLQGTVSGAMTTRVYDKDSGLMLKQTVSAVGAPEVILTQYKVPNWEAIAPPAPPPPPSNGTTPPSAPPSAPPPSGTPPSAPPSAPPSTPPSAPPAPPPTNGDFWPEEEPPKESPCCLSGLVLAMVAVAAFRSRA